MKIDGRKERHEKKLFITMAQNARGAFVHRFLRVGNFLTGRAPGGGGAACGDGAPIVKMGLPLLPVVWVCGVDVPKDPVGVEGMPPP